MKLLEDKILREGRVLPGDIIKVDGFLNHRVDTAFVRQIADEFARRIDVSQATLVMTVEASGNAIAAICAERWNLPMLYAKKAKSANISDDVYQQQIMSYTYKQNCTITVSKEWLRGADKVIIIDDFLAHGECLGGLCRIVREAGAEILAVGVCVEKGFQGGGDRLRKEGVNVQSLCIIDKAEPGNIVFRGSAQKHQTVVILDFGGQYSQVVARRVREKNVYCEVKPWWTPLADIARMEPIGVIFTGGPSSVYQENAPAPDRGIYDLGVPILGICYGCQLLAHMLGGRVEAANDANAVEYGKTVLQIVDRGSVLLQDVPDGSVAWMSHSDYLAKLPDGFCACATTQQCPTAAIYSASRNFYGVQFHPEVDHTQHGRQMIQNFLYKVCGARGDWTISSYLQDAVAAVRAQVGDGSVVLGLSGGVDSAVAAALVSRAIGDRLTCVLVDHGFMREREVEEIEEYFGKQALNFVKVDASEQFFARLSGVSEPEQKRKVIGELFVRVFEQQARQTRADFLCQGTIYPDVVESGAAPGAATIKSHHNVGGLPADLGFRGVVEPLRPLFKDEVRGLGRALGLPEPLVRRQPFPGPGLAIRVLGAPTREKVAMVRRADAIFRQEIGDAGSQAFAVLANALSVGVQGDRRFYGATVVLRCVETTDFMTADWARLPYDALDRAARRIVNEVPGVARVVYDVTSKPPATIEWE